MKTGRYTEAQIIAILRQAEGSVPVAQLCREHGMSDASFYKWRAGHGISDQSVASTTKPSHQEAIPANSVRPSHVSRFVQSRASRISRPLALQLIFTYQRLILSIAAGGLTMLHQNFGYMPDGTAVNEVVLTHGGLIARFIGWGAVLRDLQLEVSGQPRGVVLGFAELAHYLDYARNHGANVGRFGGRVRDGRLVVDGQDWPLARNLRGRHHSHGGHLGLGRRNWRLADAGPSWVTFAIRSPEGDEGYPGELEARCRYDLDDMCLLVTIDATVSAACPVNFLHHSYFNLDGAGLIHDHQLQILADQVLESDAEGLPTGHIVPVAETRFDFRRPRQIPLPAQYNTSYILAGGLQDSPRPAGRLISGDGRLQMEVRTTEPGLHFYSGFAATAPVPYMDGRPCLPETGLCLEATRFNDAMNQPHLDDVIVRPNRPYRQRTEFHFTPS